MRGIVINPYLKRVYEVDLADGSLQSIYYRLSTKGRPISIVEIVSLTPQEYMYVDEEGLFKEEQMFFTISGRPVAGCGLILRLNDDGDNISSELNLAGVELSVEWGIQE